MLRFNFDHGTVFSILPPEIFLGLEVNRAYRLSPSTVFQLPREVTRSPPLRTKLEQFGPNSLSFDTWAVYSEHTVDNHFIHLLRSPGVREARYNSFVDNERHGSLLKTFERVPRVRTDNGAIILFVVTFALPKAALICLGDERLTPLQKYVPSFVSMADGVKQVVMLEEFGENANSDDTAASNGGPLPLLLMRSLSFGSLIHGLVLKQKKS